MYFPPPYPDELLGSVVGRAVRHLALPFRVVLKKVLLRPDSNLSFFLPSNLRRLGELTERSPETLAMEHSPFPYWSAYSSPTAASRILRSVVEGREAGHRREYLKVTWSAATRLRFCRECLANDLRMYREAYWHRNHFLPTLLECPVHGAVLFEDVVPWSERRAFRLLPDDLAQARPIVSTPNHLLRRALADTTLSMLSADWQRRFDWAEVYRKRAASLGYISARDTTAAAQLAGDLQDFYGVELLDALGCGVGGALERAWPVLILRPGIHSAFSPVKHVVIKCFLDLSSGARPVTPKRRGRAPVDTDALDPVLAELVRKRWAGITAAGSRMTIRALLMSLEARSIVRRRRKELPQTDAVLKQFRSSQQWQPGGFPAAARLDSALRRQPR